MPSMSTAGPSRAELEPMLDTVSREWLVEYARSAADAVDRLAGENEKFREQVKITVGSGQTMEESRQSLFRAIGAAAKGLNVAADFKSSQAKNRAKAVAIVRGFLNEIVDRGCAPLPWSKITLEGY